MLVSNAGQSNDESTLLSSKDIAQSFTTGTNASGYTLTSLELQLQTAGTAPTVTLHSGSATGTKVADFTRQASVSSTAGLHTFTATGAVNLNPSTEYWVVADGGSVNWTNTSQVAEDSGAADGWSIADVGQDRNASSEGSFANSSTGRAYRLRVNGTVNPPSLVSNLGQTQRSSATLSSRDLAQSFMTWSNRSGYTLTSIELLFEGAATAPTVTLHRGSATGPKVADFTSPGNITSGTTPHTFTPAAPVRLSPYTRYWVVAEYRVVVAEGDTASWRNTSATAEDAGAVSGFSIADARQTRSADSDGSFTEHTTAVFMLRVNGTANRPGPAPTLVSNLSQSSSGYTSLTTALHQKSAI